MKKSLVLSSFLKQRTKQLKKEKSLSQNQALNEAAKELGYSNYRNYLNLLESTRKQSKSFKDVLLKKISSEKDMSKKMDLAISFIQKHETPFQDLLDILKLFRHAEEGMQSVCEQSNLKDEIQKYWLNYFLSHEGKAEIEGSFYENYIAKDISLSNLCYAIVGDRICVDGWYDLTIEFEFEVEDERYREYPHFQDHLLSGCFEITIDWNKEITTVNSDIGQS
ncbi:MAG TPA: hypothetical protein VMR37_07555 [Rhabdochlamydiaceae bacterium]|nr:hypothetical protein [Rhabdochlamydiaceae bacterium]